MLEISFQMDQRKETLINSYGETKECDLLYVTSIFLRCFYPLLEGCQTGQLPASSMARKSYDMFLRHFRSFWGELDPGSGLLGEDRIEDEECDPELNFEKFPFAISVVLDQKPENIVFYALEITKFIDDDIVASIWLESVMMYCAVYYWLAPKVVGKKDRNAKGESRRKPSEMYAETEISSFNKESKENKIIQTALDKMKKYPERKEVYFKGKNIPTCVFSQPLFEDLLTGIFSKRVKTVQMDMDIRYPLIPREMDPHDVSYSKWKRMRPERASGRKYIAETLLPLAWVEISQAIEHDIYVNTCEFCGKALILHKQYAKRLCGAKRCKRLYDHRQGQRRKEREKKKRYDHMDKKSQVEWK